jgi:hypothetical protein
MGTKILYQQINTTKSVEEIKSALKKAFQPLEGTLMGTSHGVTVIQGKKGLPYGFTADLRAETQIRQIAANRFEIECDLTTHLNTLGWICVILGPLGGGLPWIIPLLYLFVKPEKVYQPSLDQVAAVFA